MGAQAKPVHPLSHRYLLPVVTGRMELFDTAWLMGPGGQGFQGGRVTGGEMCWTLNTHRFGGLGHFGGGHRTPRLGGTCDGRPTW